MLFDLPVLKQNTAQLDLSGVDFDAFRDRPLSPAALRCLQYMHDVEYHTVCYLRDLLVTTAHRDHEIASFLTFWVFEEYWHGEAIGQVLAAHDQPADAERVEPLRRKLARRESLKPLLHGLGSLVAGKEWLAVHMTWGAVNEWTTQAGYARLSAREKHPILTDLLKRIMRQEGRHIDFYSTHARDALSRSARAQKLVRFTLRRLWSPVGAGVMPQAEVDHLIDYLFCGPDGAAAAARIDRQVDRLPGQDGLHLLQKVVTARAA
ncbi:MAG: ferritin-like domain-containing protein [Acidimicrobiales bacterium]